MKIRWRFGIIAGLVLTAFSLFPQAKLVYDRGASWNGHFAYNDVDEAAYSAYLNSLINGRPRKSDPYTGLDDAPDRPKAESVFSIQFAAPYLIATPARVIGMNADAAMVVVGALTAFATGFVLFWLIGMITGDEKFAMASSLSTVCFGTLAAGEGAIREILIGEIAYPFFPGFRRYVPAVAFPVFFVFCGLLWKLFVPVSSTGEADGEVKGQKMIGLGTAVKSTVVMVGLMVLCFGFTIFSYFYLWTAAAALLFCLAAFVVVIRPVAWADSAVKLLITAVCCLAMLLPFGWLLSKRALSVDTFQLAVNSRSIDLFRFPEVVAFVAVILMIVGIASKRVSIKDPGVIFICSLITSVFVMFNQQVITGTSLQPIHYQVFVGNYVATLALLLAGWVMARSFDLLAGSSWRIATLSLAGAAVIWGGLECHLNSRVLDETNIRLDASIPIARRLREAAAGSPDDKNATVLAYDLLFADKLPGETPQNVLWARHQAVFSSLSKDESDRRFFCYLYYLNVDGIRLERLLRSDHVTITALFGWDRHTDRLSVNARPLADWEVRDAVLRYEQFRKDFDIRDATSPRLSFAVVPEGDLVDLSNLRRWYDLDEMESAGGSVLYRVRLRGGSVGTNQKQ